MINLASPRKRIPLWFRFTRYSWGWNFRLTSWPFRMLVLVNSRLSGVYVSTDGTPPDLGNYPKWGFWIKRKPKRQKKDKANHA